MYLLQHKHLRFLTVPTFATALLSILVSFSTISCQTTRFITTLDSKVKETSGLIYLRGALITHNDSGNKAYLYVIDTATGKVRHKVKIKGVDNVDWEDICHDGQFIYIGDTGNNRGTRRDLTIYKVSIADLFDRLDGKISAQVIHYDYREQRDFSSRNHKHNFDAEALIAYRDSLILFTKNWANHKTYIYALPKMPGEYHLSRIDSLDVGGLITGGVYDANQNRILLSGYLSSEPFLVELGDLEHLKFSNATYHKFKLFVSSSTQTEGIALYRKDKYFLSGESDNMGHPASLYEVTLPKTTSTVSSKTREVKLFPNPANTRLQVQFGEGPLTLTVYDLWGRQMIKTGASSIRIDSLPPGVYYLHVLDTRQMRDAVVTFRKE